MTAARPPVAAGTGLEAVLVINAGSSSLKFALHAAGGAKERQLWGQVEAIGVAPRLRILGADGACLESQSWAADALNHEGACAAILAGIARHGGGIRISAAGHRVVHGGARHAAPARVDDALLAELAALVPLAPLHQPHNLAPIRALAAIMPDLPQVACFDTAFHRAQAPRARAYALPRALSAQGVQRYGFHGLSYEYVAGRLAVLAPDLARRRVIIAHLGNGASLCALNDGRSVASTMGFTALDGLMMGTRCGSLDPGVLLYLMQAQGLDAAALQDLLYRQSGLLGVSGISSDMRALRASAEAAAREAIDLFVYRIVREIGSLAASLGGLDGLIFTAGIGENDAATRAEVAEGCAWLGLRLDAARNEAAGGRISAQGSTVSAWVIPTDEAAMISRHTAELLDPGAQTAPA